MAVQESSLNDSGSVSPELQNVFNVFKKFATLLQVDLYRINAVCAENARPDGNRSAVIDIFVQNFDTFGASISVAPLNVADAETIVESLDRVSGCLLSDRRYSVPLEQVECYFPGLTQEIRGRLLGRAEHWKAVALLNGLAAEDASAGPTAIAGTNNPPVITGVNNGAGLQPAATPEPTRRIEETPKNPAPPPRRTPDIETSRKRITLQETLARELATLKERLKTFCDAPMLKREFPKFELWNHINETELKELADGEDFTPKAYAGSIALRMFGLNSPATLKKDRQKLKKAARKRAS